MGKPESDDASTCPLHKIFFCFRNTFRDNKKLFFNLKNYGGILSLVFHLQQKVNPSATGTYNDHSYHKTTRTNRHYHAY